MHSEDVSAIEKDLNIERRRIDSVREVASIGISKAGGRALPNQRSEPFLTSNMGLNAGPLVQGARHASSFTEHRSFE